MSDLFQMVKKIAVQAVEAEKPVNIELGKVISERPLIVKIGQHLELDEGFLILTSRMKNEAIPKGTGVILLREQGGQRYVLLDKM